MMTDTFVELYNKDTPRWTEVESLAEKLGWTSLLSRTVAEYFQVFSISREFTYEMVESMTRVNYGQVRPPVLSTRMFS